MRTFLAVVVLLMVAAPAVAQSVDEDRVTITLVAANGISSMVDYGVTMYGVGTGQLQEANPVLRWAERRPVAMGVTKGLVLTGTTYAILKLRKNHPKWALLTAVGVTSLNVYVATRNAKMLSQR